MSAAIVLMLISIAGATPFAYITNLGSNSVYVINTTNNAVTAMANGLSFPVGVAVTPDGANVYITNNKDNTVSIINTTNNTAYASANVGNGPAAFGQFIPTLIAPIITWSSPADIVYGTALNSAQLDAKASVPGTFVYTPTSGTVLNIGSRQTLSTTFIPNDTANYTTESASVSINVLNTTRTTPTITWSNPANISYGTALSSTQLDATASVPGTVVYNPLVGTILSLGQNQALNVTFTPTDIANYTTATAGVSINVNPKAASFAYITNMDSNNVSVIHTATNNIVTTVNVGSQPWDVAISPNGQKAYVTNGGSNNLSVIDTATNNVTATVDVGLDPSGVTVSPDGQKVYVANFGNATVSVIDAATYNVTATVLVEPDPEEFVFTPDGKKIYLSTYLGNNISVIDTATNNVTATIPLGPNAQGVEVSPDGTTLYVVNCGDSMFSAGTISVINTTTNNVTATMNAGDYPIGIEISPNGQTAYVTNLYVNTVTVINTTTNNVTAIVNGVNNPNGIAITRDGTKLYVADCGGNHLSIIDTATNNVTATVNVGPSWVMNNFIGNIPMVPTITWSNPANISCGTALSSTQLDATANVLGRFFYTPTAGTLLNLGQNQPLNVTFTPTDSTNCTTATDTVYINVTQATPTLAWTPNPLASIVTGTALGADLDATATYPTNGQTVPGNFVYTDETGAVDTAQTVLSAGTHTLNATFTPNDTTNYTSGGTVQNSITVTSTVTSAALTITKTPNPLTYSASGQTITYTYTVKNTGDGEIKGPITVTDDKFGTITIPNSDTLSPASSVTGTATYTITDTDINAGSVTNAAYAKGSFNSNPISSPLTVALVRYKQPTKKEEHNEEEHNGDRDNYGGPGYSDYGGAVVPVAPLPVMSNSPMYGNVPNGYGRAHDMYTSGPSTTEIQNSESNVHKTKAHLSKHKHKHEHKHHTTKHHKNREKTRSIKVDKK